MQCAFCQKAADSSWDNYYALAEAAAKSHKWNKAAQLYRLCLQEAEDTGAETQKMLTSMDGLANTLTQLDRVAEARALYERAYKLALESSGAKSAATVKYQLDLASCWESEGENRKAEKIYERLLAAAPEQKPDKETEGQIYLQASRHFEKRKQPGKSAEYFAQAKSRLGSDLLAQGSEKQIKKPEPASADTKPEASSGSSSYAASTAAAADLDQNDSAWERSKLDSRESISTSKENQSQSIVTSAELVGDNSLFSTMTELSASQKRYQEAEPLYKKIIEIDEQSLGPEHPGLASDLTNLARLYLSQKQYALAIPLFERAISIYVKTYGQSNLAVVEAKLQLAIVYEKLGRSGDCERMYKEALSGTESIAGKSKAITASILNRLGFFYYKQSRYAEANAIYIKALSCTEEALGPYSRLLAASCQDYAKVLRALNKSAEADLMEARAREILASTGGSTSY